MALRALHLDFANADAAAAGRSGLGLVLLVAGAAGAIAVGVLANSLETEKGELEARLATAERAARRTEPARDAEANRAIADELSRANTVLGQIGVPWEDLFSELEAAGNEEIALVAVQPDNAGRQVRIGGEAKSFAALVEYVKRLEARSALAEVVLASHEMKNANQSIAFTVSARWVRPS